MFDIQKAHEAQNKYCDENDLPIFAPFSGMCYRCSRNIYLPFQKGDVVTGISVDSAGRRLIAGCPHCGYSFCD